MNEEPSDESSEPVEVFEHVPWAHLAEPPREKKLRVAYVAAGAIALAALGALAARSINRSPEPPPVAVSSAETTPLVHALPPPPSRVEALTEADLLAVTPGRGEVSAAVRAEWFVSDYFSSGGNPGAHQAVLDALPEGSRLGSDSGAGFSSYVEWAATTRIEAIGTNQFRSTVLFRILVSEGEAGYVRLPVQAVDVMVAVDAGGGTRVMDLPMPATVPPGPPFPAWSEPVEEIPAPVQTAALRIAGSWGDEASVVEASRREGGWRVVVGVADEAGIRWPLTLWLTNLGEPLWPSASED